HGPGRGASPPRRWRRIYRPAARRSRRGGTGHLIFPAMYTILLVEDNEMNRDMLSRRLARRGYDVAIALDGAEGVRMARETRPDLILMDMSLPVLDGWEATRRMKADAATAAIPVIALTAHAMTDDEARARAAGCDDFDTKPVDLERLLAKIERWLPSRSEVSE